MHPIIHVESTLLSPASRPRSPPPPHRASLRSRPRATPGSPIARIHRRLPRRRRRD